MRLPRPAKPNERGLVIVGVSDVQIATEATPDASIITYALGSCIGVTVYDPVARVGGMLHYMLPSPINDDATDKGRPAMFGSTGVPMLFKSVYELGAEKERLVVCAAGGAEILNDSGHFRIGPRNRTILRRLLFKNSVLLSAEETGDTISRTLKLDLSDGRVSIFSNRTERTLWSV